MLNELEVLACDIKNAYLTTDCREWIWVVPGPEFGSEDGKNTLERKALYELNISGAAFRAFLVETLDAMGYCPNYADP